MNTKMCEEHKVSRTCNQHKHMVVMSSGNHPDICKTIKSKSFVINYQFERILDMNVKCN